MTRRAREREGLGGETATTDTVEGRCDADVVDAGGREGSAGVRKGL